ncbi:MAG TPA: heterodisulfide reductase-related iron-sulfur binding cluster [Spirochaetota bacterium]|nr:heterodisulfide reductase-related iron-sulfur binding cluster [Spirochaetota bacterium]
MNFAGLYDMPATDIARQMYFNVGGPHGFMRWGIYIFMFAAFIYLGITLYRRIIIWRQGVGELRTDFHEKRIYAFFKYVIFQAKVLRESYTGIFHVSLFWGFIGLFIVTAIIVVQEDITELFFHTKFIYGNFYLIWSLAGDLFGGIVLVGLVMAIYRRYKVKPSRLDTKMIDTFALALITFIVLTGFFNEAMRIAITDFPVFEVWSPFGYALAHAFSWIGRPALETMHYVNWWLHMVSAFSFIGLIGSDKLGHVATTMLNVYFQNLDNENENTKYSMQPISPATFETAESFGVGSVEQFTWKQLMDGDACTRCGRCQDNCPAYLTEKPLSPKKIINDVKAAMDERAPKLMEAKRAGQDIATVESKMLIGEHVLDDEIWSCTNCAACVENCPVQIEHINKINDMRRFKILMEGSMAPELQTTLSNMENNSNPFGFGFAGRGDWLPAELGVKTLSEDSAVDFLFYVGCYTSFDKRNQKIGIALIKILQKAGYKVGILGAEEACCGDAAMRAGNEYLFHALATQNLETFKAYGVKKIVTTCPHGYNVIKKEYAKFAKLAKGPDGAPLEAAYEVYHHTEIIADLIKKGKIKLVEPLNETVTYHDSCFLGRYNEIYAAPRDIIKAIPGTKIVEMSRNHHRSFCCGAGGARMFIEEHLGARINQFRTKDAQASGATKIATACPFCLTMLADGANELDIQNLQTFDLAEYVFNAMEK